MTESTTEGLAAQILEAYLNLSAFRECNNTMRK
jgi:hypothetical protein